ncbi:maleylpyruvate isomerase [Allocatelliglobosispora scoriae]|uniref:Maleylpyruvate isomerase n=1 Tax=Allocatelliglobosispora scoriae TaxID=643052 RepID=A0A841C0M4_9ACTN|nr:maleylpyruvate isomerase family mycothiol-dependent enzyme [Allocatelliglobosispora scoriae]MBB5872703.1 maleylpyruvate isomerase [Allocatelliglobosispora scoriae]
MTTTAPGPAGLLPALLAGAADSAERLSAHADLLDDATVRGDSALPTWSRGHVLNHLARHADSLRRTAEAASRGEVVEAYEGGAAGRAAEIEAGAGRSAAELAADLRESGARLAEAWHRLDPSLWQAPTKALTGLRPLFMGVASRWLELEIHHVDLDLGYAPTDWPDNFVSAALPIIINGLPGRASADRPAPATTWLLWSTDLATGWSVDTTTTPASVQPAAERAEAAFVVEGPGHALLAWLLGRSDGTTLTATSPAALALPGHYPFP